LTYNAKVDTNTGHIELDDNNEGIELNPVKLINTTNSSENWDNSDIMKLRNKFAEVSDLV